MSRLDLVELAGAIERPDEAARTSARERLARVAATRGSLGRLEDLALWLAGAQGSDPPRPLDTVRVVVIAGDHGVAAAGVSAQAAGQTVRVVADMVAGRAAVNVLCRLVGAELHLADLSLDADDGALPADVRRHKVRRSSGRIDLEDALTPDEAEAAFLAGTAIVDSEVDSGADLLVAATAGVGSTTPAAALAGLLTRNDASVVTGRGGGIDDATWMRKCATVRDAMRRGRPVLGEQLTLLATVGGADIAAMTGFLLQAAVRRTPVVLDGMVASVCGLVAQRIAFRSADWWLAGQLTAEPSHRLALNRLSLEPVLDLGIETGHGSAGVLAVPLLRGAASLLTELSDELPEGSADDT